VLIVEAVWAALDLLRGPSQKLLEDNPELHAAFQSALAGDRNAFAKLYTHYMPSLLRVANSRTKSPEDAEEAVHDVLVKIMSGEMGHANVTTPQGLTGYLMRAVRNAVSNKSRAAKAGPSAKGTVVDPETGEVKQKRYKLKAKSIGADPEAGEVDPTAASAGQRFGEPTGKTTGLNDDEKKIVHMALDQAMTSAKLGDKERDFLQRLIGSGEDLRDITGTGAGAGRAAKLAAEVWPEMQDKSRQVHAKRIRDRFLKQFCGDKALNALIPTGHSRETASSAFHTTLGQFKSACDEAIQSGVFDKAFLLAEDLIHRAGSRRGTLAMGARS